jgi:hypothetical protein
MLHGGSAGAPRAEHGLGGKKEEDYDGEEKEEITQIEDASLDVGEMFLSVEDVSDAKM